MPYEPETMTFALAADGRKVHIDEVINGLACECLCLKCVGSWLGGMAMCDSTTFPTTWRPMGVAVQKPHSIWQRRPSFSRKCV